MEHEKDGSLDGSSILPVSSLRSRFEQLSTTTAAGTPTDGSRAPSPRPKSMMLEATHPSLSISNRSSLDLSSTDWGEVNRGRKFSPAGIASPRQAPPRPAHKPSFSPSPTRTPLVLAAVSENVTAAIPLPSTPPVAPPPAVTVEPPRSPPKNLGAPLANPASLLAAETMRASPSPISDDMARHSRTLSRSQTSFVESRKSAQPPEPPPPRRSGEFRRDSSMKPTAVPPPVKRSEKPKIPAKPLSFADVPDGALIPTSPTIEGRISPFTTPPSSNGTPERETPPRVASAPIDPLLRSPKASTEHLPRSPRTIPFEPPPIHHVVASKRDITPIRDLKTSDHPSQRPVLPARRDITPELQLKSNGSAVPPRPSLDVARPIIHSTIKKQELVDAAAAMPPPPRRYSYMSQPLPPSRAQTLPVEPRSSSAEYRPLRISADAPVAEVATKYAEYPDASRANRRPPYLTYGPKDIMTKYETRIFDVFGEYVCTSGFITRVWNLLTGELLLSHSHGETVKIMSVAFKPSAEIKAEGSRLWLGSNQGEILEVDIPSQDVIATTSSAHARREVIKIYRYLDQMWTLDDVGSLHVWGPDSSGAPNLNNPTQVFRIPKEHSFSMVVGGELWHATGKDIRIFRPSLDGKTQFQLLARPLTQPSAGVVTSGAVLSSQNAVCFGHSDGKVSVYSRESFECLSVINVSQYKIISLTSVRDHIWAGYSSGKILVYDTQSSPWVVRKEWCAHDKPVLHIHADTNSFWMLDRSHVVSLGTDNSLRLWDGLLQEDWLESEMHTNAAKYCSFEQMKALVMTWNAGAATPHSLRYNEQDASFFQQLLQTSDSPDILVFGFQELVDLEDKKTTAKSFFKSKKKDTSEQTHMSHQYRDWRDFLTRCLDDFMPGRELYQLLHTSTMVGLFTCVFVKASLRPRIKSLHASEVKRGMGGLHGNKGALILRFLVDDSSICLVNCHLAAGQTHTANRNNDVTVILESENLPAERDPALRLDNFVCGGDGTMITDHEICILNGDLNYRIDAMGRDTVVAAVRQNNLSKLLERDQLLVSRRKNPAFPLRFFKELPIAFAPTYKYDVGTDTYDTSEKKRSPAWCDRLLYRGLDRVEQIDYLRHEVRVSDHRPVTGRFLLQVKTVNPQKRAVMWEVCQHRFKELRQKRAYDAKLDFLQNVRGLDLKTCQKILAQ